MRWPQYGGSESLSLKFLFIALFQHQGEIILSIMDVLWRCIQAYMVSKCTQHLFTMITMASVLVPGYFLIWWCVILLWRYNDQTAVENLYSFLIQSVFCSFWKHRVLFDWYISVVFWICIWCWQHTVVWPSILEIFFFLKECILL